MLEYVPAQTFHARHGALENAFRYGVDFVLTDLEIGGWGKPWLISHNRFNLWSVHDRRHGGPRDAGRGRDWFREELAARGFPVARAKLFLLTQPSYLWFHFNPVSFWFATLDGALCAFIAEVNSTFGQRHCYFCAHEDFRPITPQDQLLADKRMHVSPFQQIAGEYRFNIVFTDARINIRIDYRRDGQGVLATLTGPRQPARDRALLWAALRRPLGAARVLALIHWQAAILWLKRAPFLRKQPPPDALMSDSRNLRRPGK